MHRLKILLLIFTSLFFDAAFAQKEITLGVVIDCPNSNSPQFLASIVKEAEALLNPQFALVLKEENILYSDCSAAIARTNIDNLLADDEIDMILGVDAIGSHLMATGGPYKKPVIAAVIINAQAQKVPMTKKGRSGVKNLNYLELPISPIRDLEIFQEMIGFEKLTIVIDEAIFTGIPEILAYSESNLKDLGYNYEYIYTENTAEAVLNKIDDSFDGAILYPTDILLDDQFQLLIDGLNTKNLKTFSIFGRVDVDRGVLAGVAPASNVSLLSRRIALNMQRILNGEDAEDLGVKLIYNEELVINMATARKIDFSPSWELLAEAVLINEERDDIDRTISLFSAIADGLVQNLSIELATQDVAISEKDVDIARSSLLPELDAFASYRVVDNNTAEISNGQNPQNKAAGSLQLNQVIYSEQITANKQIQELLYQASEASLDAETLNIILDVSTAYLGLMQTKTAENIQKQNLDVTRKNLELARVSSSLGQTGPSDLYRWQGEIATAKSDLMNATAFRKQRELALNQVLNRPIDEPFLTQEVDITDERFMINNAAILQYVSNPRQFYQFADFMVSRANENSPDLLQVDLNIRAQERAVLLNQRNKYVPTLSLGGIYNYEFYRGGSGTEIPPPFMAPNDWNWNLQVGASLPIFQGGYRTAKVQQSSIELMQINTQRLNTERLIEQKVRKEMENVRASYTNLGLTKEAEEAVVKNFELVQDSYAQGLVTITQLLDAQQAARSALFNSANTIYIFLVDLLNLERPTGQYYMLMTEEQKEEFINQFIIYLSDN